jgi:hypothetical protein
VLSWLHEQYLGSAKEMQRGAGDFTGGEAACSLTTTMGKNVTREDWEQDPRLFSFAGMGGMGARHFPFPFLQGVP